MSCTVFYKGTLKDAASVSAVFDYVSELTEHIDCRLEREEAAMTVHFHKGSSEPLVFAFAGKKLNEFCKWNGDSADELYRIFDLFVRIRPLFTSLSIEDDEGLWHAYRVRGKKCRIQLRPLASENEQRLLQRVYENAKTAPNALEALLLKQTSLRPYSLSILRIIIQDLIRIMKYESTDDFSPETIVERAESVMFVEGHMRGNDIRNFEFVFPYLMLCLWFSYAFTYRSHGLVYQAENTSGLKTSKMAALYGTSSIFLNRHSGGAANAKGAEMAKFAAKLYPPDAMGEVYIADEPKNELAVFVSMMDYLGFCYIGV